MKWSSLSITLLTSLQILISCSSNDDEQQAGTTSTVTSSTANPSAPGVAVEAKEKKTDAAAQGLKGKVQVLSESILTPGNKRNLVSKNVFKYDKDGNRLELISYKPDGKIISNLKSTYTDGRITKEETILGDGTIELIADIKTDAKGNRIEQRETRPVAASPLFNYTHYYKYDEKGQMLERTARRGNGRLMFRYLFKYDDNGNRIEWTQLGPDSTVVGRVVYKFDNKNNMVEETSYAGSSTPKATYTYTYEFDRKGNWTRRTKLQDKTAIEIKERQYDYQ